MKRLSFSLFCAVLLLLCLSACQAQKTATFSISVKPYRPGLTATSVLKPLLPEAPTPAPSQTAPTPAPTSAIDPVTPPSPSPSAVPKPHTLYILMYHSVAEDGTQCNNWTITTSRLREDLQWITENGYTTVLPRELAAGEPLPEKAVMLTFDDGYADNYTLLYPILQEYQAKAVVSLVTKYISDEYATAFLNWDQCREMVQSGLVEFGSHTHGLHASGILRQEGESKEDYEARVFPDLQQSIDEIRDGLGLTPAFFAYPHGLVEPWALDLLKEAFFMAVTTTYGTADLSRDLYQLPRFNITVDIKASHFLK